MVVLKSTDPENPQQITEPLDPTTNRHLITLGGLSPATEYQAVVVQGDQSSGYKQATFAGEIWGPVHFHTLGKAPTRIGVLGDASFGDEATSQLVSLMAEMDLDFVIHTGDVVYQTESSDPFNSYLSKFYLPFEKLLKQGPIYTVPGNHDYDASVRYQDAPFYDYVFPAFDDEAFNYPEERRANQFYALAVGDIQFLMMDSQAIYGVGGREAQDEWMKERLSDPTYRATIPVFHVSPYSSSIVHPEDSDPIRLSWNYIFEGANVPLVMSGHFHHYERLLANAITYIVTGGGSSTLYAGGTPRSESILYQPRTHFVLLEIYGSRIEMRDISREGEVFDQVTIPLD